MKTRVLITLIAGLFCWRVSAQTADDWVNQGRSYLAAHNITAANTNFAQALAVNPNHQTANALYAITRILVLPSQTAGSNFLTRIGFPIAGRSIYAWDSIPPKDTNGLWLAPSGVDANEFIAQLRTNVLPALSGAGSNVAAVTQTNFTVSLTSSETTIADVTLDYGDLKLIQAGLYASEYCIYTLNAQNFDAQVTALRALYTDGILSAQQVLSDYPQMFTFSTTNDLQAARTAFTNAVNTYMAASAFINTRPTNEVRLFNYNPASSKDEGNFRLVLQDLKNSLLIEPQILALDPNLIVDMSPQFDGSLNLRSLLPKFDGNSIELGSLPDLTFGGMVYGLTREETESYLGDSFTMLPVGRAPELSANNSLNLTFTTLRGHNYALEASTNLVTWQVVASFTAINSVSTIIDSQTLSRRFYRLRDDSVLPPANDNFANRITITGTSITTIGTNNRATREAGEPYDINNNGGESVWWSWAAPKSGTVTISTIGSNFDTILGIFTGTAVFALNKIISDDDSGGNFTSKVTFFTTGDVMYQISVDGFGGSSGSIQLSISMP
jgi:hypothetical protein